MIEYEAYLKGRKKGYLTFLTFGTAFDPGEVDLMFFDVPLKGKINLFTPTRK